jgi:AraC-like DNA-binding protein
MRPIPMVRASAIVPFVDFLETAGAPAERLLEDVGLSPCVVEDPERLLPLHGCLAFLGHIARAEKLADLGLTVGLQTRFDQLGAFADMVRGANTLYEALNRLIGAIALFNSGERVWLDCQGERAQFCHAYDRFDAPGRRHGELYATVMMIAAIRAVLGPQWMPNGVRLSRAEEPNRMRYETMLGVPVVCEDRSQAVVFARALLAARPMTCRPSPNGLEDDYELLRATAPAEDFAGCVRQTIETLLCDGYPDIHHTAEMVGLSARTLQRRLARADESYNHLVESVRLDTGIRLLSDCDTRLVDIAAELGYADQANFTRAFRRLTGMSPRAFRRAQSSSLGVSA